MTATAYELIDAIRVIYRAQVYEAGKRENGISLEMVAAICAAAELAGLKSSDVVTTLTPAMAEISALLELLADRGVYPKLEGRNIVEWLSELRALAAIHRKEPQ